MNSISLPKKPKFEKIGENAGKFIIENCCPGYGVTLGNTLRRVLLSSLTGAAATSVKIKGVTHEFTSIKGVKEDIVQIILNLKQVYFKLDKNTEEAVVTLKAKGGKDEREILAKEIKCHSDVKIANGDKVIATLTGNSADLDMEIKVKKGVGFIPIESQDRKEKEIGSIAMDAIFNPMLKVNFLVDNMRVGKRTDYDKITLEIFTNGTISPKEAYEEAVEILMAQFNAVSVVGQDNDETKEITDKNNDKDEILEDVNKKEDKEKVKDVDIVDVSDLNFSTRTKNILDSNDLKTIQDIAKHSESELRNLEGMGDKSIKEIKKGISKFGIILKASSEK